MSDLMFFLFLWYFLIENENRMLDENDLNK